MNSTATAAAITGRTRLAFAPIEEESVTDEPALQRIDINGVDVKISGTTYPTGHVLMVQEPDALARQIAVVA